MKLIGAYLSSWIILIPLVAYYKPYVLSIKKGRAELIVNCVVLIFYQSLLFSLCLNYPVVFLGLSFVGFMWFGIQKNVGGYMIGRHFDLVVLSFLSAGLPAVVMSVLRIEGVL